MTRKLESDFQNCRKFYCHCQRISFGQMIGCDNSNCEKAWFPYKCVGLKRAPKPKWFSSTECEKKQNVGGSTQTGIFSKILFIDFYMSDIYLNFAENKPQGAWRYFYVIY